jgi:Domain of unknown function (DUF4177)
MFEYAFVRIPVAYKSGSIDPSSYQSAIEERARIGWKFVQIFVEMPAAIPGEYTLIFERPAAP